MKWEMVKLGEVCTILGGGTPDRSNLSYWDGSIPWVTVKDFKSTTIESAQESITELGLRNSASNLIKTGTIIVPTRMALGKAAVCKIDIAINQDLKAIQIKDESRLNRDFLLQFLISNSSYFESRGKGATVKGITLDTLLELPIPLPPLATQRRIAEILDKADALRQKDLALLRKYDELAQAVFVDMFGDPVRNEKGWEVRKIKDIGKVTTGNTPPREIADYYGNHIEWIKSDNIKPTLLNPLKASEFLSKEGLKIGRCVEMGAVLITCIAGSLNSIGNSVLTDRKVAFNQQINAISPKESFNSLFLLALIRATRAKILTNASTSMKKMISKSTLENIELIAPPISLQKKFANIYNNIEQQKELVRKQHISSETLFGAFLQKSFG